LLLSGEENLPHAVEKSTENMSHLALDVARAGCNVHLYDMDTFEDHNMTGQLVRRRDIGKNKAVVAKEIIAEFSPSSIVEVYPERYTESSPTNEIVLCGFDNMEARKVAFENWAEMVKTHPHPEQCFLSGWKIECRTDADI
jgi:hypothetical protein